MSQNLPPSRPVIFLPLSRIDILLELGTLTGIICSLVIIILAWELLPNRIPVHFGLTGEPDSWGAKGMLLILPLVSAVLSVGLMFLSRSPHTFNYPVKIHPENARTQYLLARSFILWLKLEIVWLFTLIVWQQVQVALGKTTAFNTIIFWGYLIWIGVTIGFYFWQSYRHQ